MQLCKKIRRNDREKLARSKHKVVPSRFDLYFVFVQLVCLEQRCVHFASFLLTLHLVLIAKLYFFIPVAQLLLLKMYHHCYVIVPFIQ